MDSNGVRLEELPEIEESSKEEFNQLVQIQLREDREKEKYGETYYGY